MKKKLLFSLLIALAIAISSNAQKQANVWAFGDSSGLSFNGGGPSVITTSVPLQDDWCTPGTWHAGMNSGYDEGSSSICDSAGHLLFYTNGEKIWNRFGRIVPNGDSLLGNFSATQSSIILPLPGSDHIFYVFTMDAFQDTFKYGLRYTIVDACLDSGRGAVSIGQKNIPLVDSTGEKLTAVKHANGRDYWIISHKFWTDKFYAIKLTPSGLSDTVITHIGRIHMDTMSPLAPYAAIGAMTSSPDGHHIVVVNGNVMATQYISDLFDFDLATGTLSNYIDLKTRETYKGQSTTPYGCSFSPNSTKVYIGGFADTALGGTPIVAQYDLSMSIAYPDSIRNSLQWIAAVNGTSAFVRSNFGEVIPRSLQIGPDGKLYAAGNSKALWVIDTTLVVGRTYALPNILPSYAYGNAIPDCEKETLVSESPKENIRVLVYPNPVTDIFTVQCEGEWKAVITNLVGKTVLYLSGNGTGVFSKGTMTPGMYILTLETEHGTYNKKVIVQ